MADDDPGGLKRFEEWVHGFASRTLGNYVQSLTEQNTQRTTREFNDPLWSTISLSAFEAIIVDSPLFQRLRRIRQLGVVHWVYPSAAHTRFEHTLGVVHQVQELTDAINRSLGPSARVGVSIEQTNLLRLAALCHDIGHGVMSHVSENAFKSNPEITRLRKEFGDKINGPERLQLSEIVAYYIIGSPSFAELVHRAQFITKHRLPDHPMEGAQKAIVSQIVFSNAPLLQELISGPFDADKLDYMQRDALLAGIPAITDVPRLIHKVRAQEVSANQLPPRLRSLVDTNQSLYLMFGIAFSGSRTLDELLLARVLLFDKVYRHQKVRALEGMIAILIRMLSKLYRGATFELPYQFTDETLLEADSLIRARPEFLTDDSTNAIALGVVDELCARLRNRKLYVRAYVFAQHLRVDDDQTKERMRTAVIALTNRASPEQRHLLTKDIGRELREIFRLLGPEATLTGLADSSLESYVWIDPPSDADHTQKIAQAFLLQEQRGMIAYGEHSVEVPRWANAYLTAKDIGYIYCIPELKHYVFLATDALLRREFKLSTPSSVYDYLKDDRTRLAPLHDRLTRAGFYRHLPPILRPRQSRLLHPDVADACANFRSRLRGYEPSHVELGDIDVLSDEHVQSFLNQFGSDLLIDFGTKMLSKIQFIGRDQIVENLRIFINSDAIWSDARVVPLGGPKDSGNLSAYYASDIQSVRTDTIDNALASDSPIIFIDDFIGSGGQAIRLMEELLRLPYSSNRAADEERRYNPTEDQANKLRDRRFAFVYAAGWNSGKQNLESKLSEYKVNASVHVGLTENQLSRLDDLRLEVGYEAFALQCRVIGRSLLLSRTEKRPTAEEADERALGYGNSGLLITFPQNTPSQSLTCLWSGGTVDDVEWIPLLPRRPKR